MNNKFIENESFLHKHAKELLSDYLKKIEVDNDFCSFNQLSWRKNYGVFTELPFHVSDDMYYFECSAGLKEELDGENPLDNFDMEFDRGRILFVPDITIFHKGIPKYFVEVVHTNKTPQWKIDRINLFFDNNIEVYEVSAYEIMKQVNDLSGIKMKRIL